MEIKGFDGNLSEESKKALQSETWQKVRDSMKEKKEVKHFTAESTAENAYGAIWNQVVNEYLKSGYNAEDKSPDIVVMGETYKTLRRPEVTVFYDATGDTLFDVTNERLEKEYEWLMNGSAGDVAENMDTKEEDEPAGASDVTGENVESVQEPPEPVKSKGTGKRESRPAKQQAEEKLKKELEATKDKSFAEPIIGYLLERCREDEGLAEDVVQEHKTWQKCFDYIYSRSRKQANGSCAAVHDDVVYEWAEDYYHKDDKVEEEKKAKKAAEEKLKKELAAAKDKSFAEPIIGYLLERCREDEGLAEDVVQEHKTWQKCFDYIYSQARKQAQGSCAAVRDDVVYEWAEDYYHKDDKAEEEKKAKKAAKARAKRENSAAEKKTVKAKGNTDKTEKVSAPPKPEAPQAPPKPKKNGKEMDGQLDLFAMMGM